MKRVLFVIETLYGGGAERVLSNLTTKNKQKMTFCKKNEPDGLSSAKM